MITEGFGPILTMDEKNCRDFESSLGLNVLVFFITGPLQGRENGVGSSNL